MKVLDLFSGVGGIALGLHAAGMQTAAFCEINPYNQAVLKERFKGVKVYGDIRELSAAVLERDGIRDIRVLAGGFPCQDLSFAGRRAGIEGARSGLWSEYFRLICELRPEVVIVENVPGLLSAGLGRVLGDLASVRYDAVWDCIPAAAVGARHRRDRVWIVAYSNRIGQSAARNGSGNSEPPREGRSDRSGGRSEVADATGERRGEAWRDRADQPAQRASGSGEVMAYANGEPIRAAEPGYGSGAPGAHQAIEEKRQRLRADIGATGGSRGAKDVAHTNNPRLEGRQRGSVRERAGERPAGAGGASVRNAAGAGLSDGTVGTMGQPGAQPEPERSSRRQSQSRLGRVADGVSYWMDEPAGVPRVIKGQQNRVARLTALGNAVVPQVAYEVGLAVMMALTQETDQ